MITTIENQALVFSVKNNNKINKLCTPLHGEILTSLYGPSFFVSQGKEVDALFKELVHNFSGFSLYSEGKQIS